MKRIGMEKTDNGLGGYPQQKLFCKQKGLPKRGEREMGKEGFVSLVKLSFLKKGFRR